MNDLHDRVSAIGERAEVEPLVPIFERVLATQAVDPEFVSLAMGAPDNSLLPVDIAKKLFSQVLETQGGRALNYTRPAGLPPFIQAFLARMKEQGVMFDPKTHDVLVTSGGMEAMSMAAEMLLDPGDVVLVESPAFVGALSVFKLWGAEVRHVDCDQDGLNPEALDAAIRKHTPKLVLVMPDGHNPSGTTMPLKRRQQIAAVLAKHGVWAVEDSAYSLLNLDGDLLPTLQSLLPEKVFLANSVSKFLFPAARLGILLAPKAKVSVAAAIKSAYNMQASGLMQAVAAEYLNPENSYMGDYLPGLLKVYAERRDAMIAALEKEFKGENGFKWVKPVSGMFVWLEGPKDVNLTALADKSIDNGVAYVPGSMFYTGQQQGHNCARLNFASTPAEKIEPAIARLAATIKQK